MMTSASVPAYHLDDITECPICTEAFNDHRVLPCMHAYCLKCIDDWSRSNPCGRTLSCPVCRVEFQVPEKGLAELPKNFFIDKLLTVRKLCCTQPAVESKPTICDVCRGDGNDEEVTSNAEANARNYNVATLFCVECQLNYCEYCSKAHRRSKTQISHKIVDIGSKPCDERVMSGLLTTLCEKHTSKDIEVYCIDCNVPVCVLCYINSHNTHKCSYVQEAAKDFSKRMDSDIARASDCIARCHEIMQAIVNYKDDFLGQVIQVENDIHKTIEQFKQMIDLHGQHVLADLNALKLKRLELIQTTKQEVDHNLAGLEGFKKYCDEVLKKGTACDITRAASSLSNQATKLLKFDIVNAVNAGLKKSTVSFVHSEISKLSFEKLVGKIDLAEAVEGVFMPTVVNSPWPRSTMPVLSHRVAVNATVVAMTTLGNRLFAMVDDYPPVIDVYDSQTMEKQRSLSVPGVQCIGLGSSTTLSILIVLTVVDGFETRWCGQTNVRGSFANQQRRVVEANEQFRIVGVDTRGRAETLIQLNTFLSDTSGNITRRPLGLSAFNDYVFILLIDAGAICYSLLVWNCSGGEPALVNLADNIKPQCAYPLPGNQLVIRDSTSCSLSVINANGKVVRTFRAITSQPGSTTAIQHSISKKTRHAGLSVDKQGNVLVTDNNQGRIILTNASLSCAEELPLIVDEGLTEPGCLWLDETCGRLFIADRKQLLAFSNVTLRN